MTTSSLPAGSRSRASHFQQQENEKVQPITVTSGRKCCEQFGRFAPDGSWAKTFSELLVGTEDWFSSRCTLTWKLRGTKSRRLYFQLVASAPRTYDTEHGLLPTVQTQGLKVCENGKTVFAPIGMLPTPRTTDVGRGAVKDVKFENGTYFRENKKGVRFGVNITDVIASGLLPTPTTTDWNTALTPEQAAKYRSKRPNAQALTQLRKLAVDGLLPTPTANDGKNATLPESQKYRISLVAEIMKMDVPNFLPTPKANDYRSGMANRVGTAHTQQLNDTMAYHAGKTSQLNPLFVSDMMGFPIMWCDI